MYGIAVHVVTVPLTAHCLFIRTATSITMAVSYTGFVVNHG